MAESFNTSLKNIAVNYLHLLRAKVTATSAKKDIEENPFYPSLLSLSDTFSNYNIDNQAFEVDESNFDMADAPFVAFVRLDEIGKDFVLVTKKQDGVVNFLHKGRKTQSMPQNEFLVRLQKVVWLAETSEKSGEVNYTVKLKEEQKQKIKNVFLYSLIAILLAITVFINSTAGNAVMFTGISLLKFAGTATAIMLLIYEIDKNNAFVKNLCSAGGHTDCDAVLSSKAAKIMGISWSEIGFFYFASTTLYLLIPSVSFVNKTAALAITNILAAPYIAFSIYYQWRVIKQWCPLCLMVQATLFLELIWSVANFWATNNSLSLLTGNLSSFILPCTFCVLLAFVVWFLIKPVLIKAKDAAYFSSAYKRLQYNPQIFNSLLVQQPKVPDGWKQLGISIGNQNAENTIIKVCNPYCGPCAKAHAELEELIAHNSNVHVKIIFISKNVAEDEGAIVAKHLLAIAARGNRHFTQQALDDWYLPDNKDYKKFAAKYPMNGELQQQDAKIEAMSKWCEEGEVSFTPTVFINGYRLPENYEIDELKNILYK